MLKAKKWSKILCSPIALFGADGEGEDENDSSQEDSSKAEKETAKVESFDASYVETLRKEAAARRTAAKEATERADKLQAELEERKLADLGELEKANALLEAAQKKTVELTTSAEQAQALLVSERISNAVTLEAIEAGFQDPRDALSMISQEEILDDDGQVSSKTVKARLKALADKKPYLLKKANAGSGDGGAGTKSPADAKDWDSKVKAYTERFTTTGGRI